MTTTRMTKLRKVISGANSCSYHATIINIKNYINHLKTVNTLECVLEYFNFIGCETEETIYLKNPLQKF